LSSAGEHGHGLDQFGVGGQLAVPGGVGAQNVRERHQDPPARPSSTDLGAWFGQSA
jgi:hypothetical protein